MSDETMQLKHAVERYHNAAVEAEQAQRIARSRVQRLERQIEAMKAEVAKLGDVAEYLKTVKYRVDSLFSGAMDAWNTSAAARGWHSLRPPPKSW